MLLFLTRITLTIQQFLFNYVMGKSFISKKNVIEFFSIQAILILFRVPLSYLVALGLVYTIIYVYLKSGQIFFSVVYVLFEFSIIQLGLLLTIPLYVLRVKEIFRIEIDFLLFIVFLVIAKKIFSKIKADILLIKLKKKKKIMVFLYAIVFIYIAWLQANARNPGLSNMYWSYTLVLIFFLIVFIQAAYTFIKLDWYKNKINNLSLMTAKVTDGMQDIAYFKHDYSNLILTLTILAKKGEKEALLREINKLKKYSDNLMQPLIYEKIMKIQLTTIQGLLYTKINQAINQDIDVELFLEGNMSSLAMDEFECIRCLSIMLDNAIEYSENLNDAHIKLEISDNKIETRIVVINDYYADKKINVNTMLGQGFTTKKGHNGNGLNSITKLVKQYTNVDFFIQTDTNSFHTILIIQK